MIGLMAGGALILLTLIGVGTMISAPKSDRNAATNTASIADQMNAGGGLQPSSHNPVVTTKAERWTDRVETLFRKPKVEEPEALPVRPSGPDPRAATRVQSFSCAGPMSPSRMLICTNWNLATADYNLSIAYQAAVKDSRTPEALRRSQVLWLAKVDKLGANTDALLEAYQQRYAEFDGPTAR